MSNIASTEGSIPGLTLVKNYDQEMTDFLESIDSSIKNLLPKKEKKSDRKKKGNQSNLFGNYIDELNSSVENNYKSLLKLKNQGIKFSEDEEKAYQKSIEKRLKDDEDFETKLIKKKKKIKDSYETASEIEEIKRIKLLSDLKRSYTNQEQKELDDLSKRYSGMTSDHMDRILEFDKENEKAYNAKIKAEKVDRYKELSIKEGPLSADEISEILSLQKEGIDKEPEAFKKKRDSDLAKNIGKAVMDPLKEVGGGMLKAVLGPFNMIYQPLKGVFGSITGGLKDQLLNSLEDRKDKKRKYPPKRAAMLKKSPESVYLGDLFTDLMGDKDKKDDGLGFLDSLLSGGLPGLLKMVGPMLGKMLGIGSIIAAIGMMIMDGIAGMNLSEAWGTSKVGGFIGGFLGGTKSGWDGAFSNMGKWALLGVGVGMLAAGPVGAIIGGLIGAAIGGIMGFIGGERIAKGVDEAGKRLSEQWEKGPLQAFGEVYKIVADALSAFIAYIPTMIYSIFEPDVAKQDAFQKEAKKWIDIIFAPFDFVGNIFQNLGKAFTNFFSGFDKLFKGDAEGGVKDITTGIFDVLTMFSDAFFDSIMNLEIMKPIKEWWDKTITPFTKLYEDSLKGIIEPLLMFFGDIGNFFGALFSGGDMGEASAKLGEGFNKFISSIGENLTKAFKDFIASVGLTEAFEVFEHIGKFFGDIGKAFGDFFGVLFSPNGDLDGAFKKLGENFSKAFGDLGKSVSEWFTKIGASISNWWNQMQADGKKSWDAFSTEFNKFFDGFKKFFANIAKNVGDFIKKKIIDPLGNAFMNIFKKVGNAFGNIGKWVMDKILTPVGNAIGSVFSAVGNVYGDIGKWVMDNILSPIGKAIGTAFNAVADIANKVWKWVEDNILKPVGDFFLKTLGFEKAFKWIETNIFKPIKSMFDGISKWFNGILFSVGSAFANMAYDLFEIDKRGADDVKTMSATNKEAVRSKYAKDLGIESSAIDDKTLERLITETLKKAGKQSIVVDWENIPGTERMVEGKKVFDKAAKITTKDGVYNPTTGQMINYDKDDLMVFAQRDKVPNGAFDKEDNIRMAESSSNNNQMSTEDIINGLKEIVIAIKDKAFNNVISENNISSIDFNEWRQA